MPPEMILMILSFCHDTTLCELEDSVSWIEYHKDIRNIKNKKFRLNCDNLGTVCPWCSKLYCDLCRKVCQHPNCEDVSCDKCVFTCNYCTNDFCETCVRGDMCTQCDNVMCDFCVIMCDECEEELCVNCTLNCDGCHGSFCSDCIINDYINVCSKCAE